MNENNGAEFSTTCPYCDTANCLEIVFGMFYTTGMRLEPDGFAFSNAKNCDTDEVTVKCLACQVHFPLGKVMNLLD